MHTTMNLDAHIYIYIYDYNIMAHKTHSPLSHLLTFCACLGCKSTAVQPSLAGRFKRCRSRLQMDHLPTLTTSEDEVHQRMLHDGLPEVRSMYL